MIVDAEGGGGFCKVKSVQQGQGGDGFQGSVVVGSGVLPANKVDIVVAVGGGMAFAWDGGGGGTGERQGRQGEEGEEDEEDEEGHGLCFDWPCAEWRG